MNFSLYIPFLWFLFTISSQLMVLYCYLCMAGDALLQWLVMLYCCTVSLKNDMGCNIGTACRQVKWGGHQRQISVDY
jgi:hypothetical protein